MTRYVAGFAFEGGKVALIEKQRPAWQKGKLNGIGGHIEDGETPSKAMVREFYEETGCMTDETEWLQFATLTGTDFEVNFFRSYPGNLEDLDSPTDEKVVIWPTDRVNVFSCIPNLSWLIPMAKSMPFDRVSKFSITEIYGEGGQAA